MHGDLESLFGGGHEIVSHEMGHLETGHMGAGHHDLHLHDAFEEAQIFASGAAEGAMQILGLGVHLPHLWPDATHLPDNQHHSHDDYQYHDHQHYQGDLSTHDLRGWHDVSGVGHEAHLHQDSHLNHEAHLHLRQHSEAKDSNGDGVSDGASRDLGIDPYSTHAHHAINVEWRDAQGHLHSNHGKDSDGDGWSDNLEIALGTDPHSAASHPSLVEARHYPEGSDQNLPGTFDASPSTMPWKSV